MKRVTIPGMEIIAPKQTSGQCETAPYQIKLPCVMISCGKRQSGKTVSLVSLLENYHLIVFSGWDVLLRVIKS